MTATLLLNASVLDVEHGIRVPDQAVLVEGERIMEVGPTHTLRSAEARTVDLRGRTLMPGLIDCHVHVTAGTADLAELAEWSPVYVTAHASGILRSMLERGFTTVRDAGGADFGLAQAIEERLFDGPRLVFGGHALSQTGGHADLRSRGRTALERAYPYAGIGTVCDGVEDVRRAAREEIKRGAAHIKLMLSGGVASPTDRVDSTQFSLEEIRAVVDEASAASIYVMGHAYTSRAINRALECGVRTIEHGNLMDASSPPLFLEYDAFYVPTLVTYTAMAEEGRSFGLPQSSHEKIFDVLESGLRALDMAHQAGVAIAYGTDLLGGMHAHQLRELTIRTQVQPPADILRSATVVGARLLRMADRIGQVLPGMLADLLVVDGDPLTDLSVLTRPESVPLIMKTGRLYRDRLE